MTDLFMNATIWVLPALAVLGASFLACMLLVLTQRWHGHLSFDSDLEGAQKIHETPVPRIGGLGLLIGLCIGGAVGFVLNGHTYPVAMTMVFCALPIFGAGLIEDLTKRVSVKSRLMASFASAALAVWLLDARLTDVDTPVLNMLIQYPLISVLFTCFAVGGMTNSVNIIDGLNGLAAGAVSLMLAGLTTIAWMHGDLLVMKLCLWGIAAMVGFLILNYPFGRIFLGDGGAYLAGFWVAECGVLLLTRNPSVSTWAVLLACLYPVWETVFSMYRRHVVKHTNSGLPDMAHLHHFVFQRVQRHYISPSLPVWLRHGVSSAAIWSLVACCQVVAVTVSDNTTLLMIGTVIFALGYHWIYRTMATSPDMEDHPIQAI
jgi:UDP-GlcNAc:undecaprenyl-phosphate GlcNAc-1-phosphate transferase